MRALSLVVLVLLAASLPALASGPEVGAGGEMIVVLRDGPPDGRLVVDNLAHLGFALVDKIGKPIRHHDATFTLTQNGVVLLKTDATHEYDGIFSLDYTFVTPGPYEVVAESDTGARGVFSGVVVPPQDLLATRAVLEAPATVAAFQPASFRVTVVDEAGTTVPHTDAILEVRRVDSGLLVLRTHLHTHDAPMDMVATFAQPGQYEARVLAYLAFPTGRGADLATTLASAAFVVGPPGTATPGLDPLPAAAAMDAGTPGPYLLSLAVDPEDRNGPLNHQRVSALVWDPETRQALQHVNFKAQVVGPAGVAVFSSESLHEYDGHLEIVLSQLPPGSYSFRVEASFREWTATAARDFTILPPVVPLAGPLEIRVDGAEDLRAGVPTELTFALVTATGTVVPHSEIDLTIAPAADAPPLLVAKLHAHMTAPKATITFPTAGSYVVVADGDTLTPTPTLYGGPHPGGRIVLALDVAEGPGLPLADLVPADEDAPTEPLTVPAAALGALAALAAAGVWRRRG